MTTSAAKHWCFTWNDEAEHLSYEDVIDKLGNHCDYLIFQEEKGAEGTKHYQGYAEFTKPQRLSSLRKITQPFLPHWEKRKGTRVQARDYAQKDDTRVDGPWVSGQKPWSDKSQGKRTDLYTMAMSVKEGKTDAEIFEESPAATLVHLRHIQSCRMIFKPTRTEELRVVIFYGEPGTGKTRAFWDLYPDGWSVPVSRQTGWFSNYQQERSVLLDDYSGGIPLTNLLQVLDRYPISLESKGSHVWWCPDVIVITCNVHPWGWYDYSTRQSSYPALQRRVNRVVLFTGEETENQIYSTHDEIHTFFNEMKPPTTRWDKFICDGQPKDQ